METTSAKFSELESIQFAAAIVHKSPHIASIQHKSIITRLTQTKLSLQGSPLLEDTTQSTAQTFRIGRTKQNWQEAPHLGHPPVVLGVGEHEPGRTPGLLLQLPHETLQRRAEAAPRRVELEHRGGPPAGQRRRQGPLLHVPAVRLHLRGPGDSPPSPPPRSASPGGGGGGRREVAGDDEALREGADGFEEPGELEVSAGARARARLGVGVPRPLEADEGRGLRRGAHIRRVGSRRRGHDGGTRERARAEEIFVTASTSHCGPVKRPSRVVPPPSYSLPTPCRTGGEPRSSDSAVPPSPAPLHNRPRPHR